MAFKKLKNLKTKIQNKIRNNTFYQKYFGFENGIDITDDKMVQYRKNIVIKNIIFVINMIYTLIFMIISIGDPTNSSNWLLTVLLFPVTALVNYFLGRLIKTGPEDNLSQTMAMYLAAFYMLLSSILVYVKLKYGEVENIQGEHYLSEAGYILIYIALLIAAFYQNKKMLKNMFVWVVVIVTILHFTITYSMLEVAGNSNIWEGIKRVFSGTEFRDILIRTILLVGFMLILYIYVSMSNYMQDERKKELAKRRKVQDDYTNVVTQIFDVTLSSEKITEEEKKEADILAIMVKKLSSLLSLSPEKCEEVVNYSRLHIDKKVDFSFQNIQSDEEKFLAIREQTELGSKLISRLQLKRKGEDILRATFEGSDDDTFIRHEREIQNELESEIILICDLYVSMRSVKPYKKAYNHKNTIAYMEKSFKIYFDPMVYDRFTRYSSDFEKIFDEM